MGALQILVNLSLILFFCVLLCKDTGRVIYLPNVIQKMYDGAQVGAQRLFLNPDH